MKVSTDLIIDSRTISGPLTFDQVKDTPGVYRLRGDEETHRGSAALVVMKDGRRLYVNDNLVMEYDAVLDSSDPRSRFWRTATEVPDEIVTRPPPSD
jgi:hypothetical protein